MTIETYPTMNARIVEILRCNKTTQPATLYAAQRIEELEAEVGQLQAKLRTPNVDTMPCGHPRSAIRGNSMTHWCAKCEEEAR